MPAKTGSGNGPGFADVSDFLMQLTATYGGSNTFTLTADRDRRGVPNLFVVLKHKPWTDKDTLVKELRVWSPWPCLGHQTFSGMLFKLCFEMEHKLEKRKQEREAQTSF